MTGQEPQSPRLAGGIFIFLGLLAGTILGIAYGASSLGMVLGLLGGGIIALLVWLFDRRRSS